MAAEVEQCVVGAVAGAGWGSSVVCLRSLWASYLMSNNRRRSSRSSGIAAGAVVPKRSPQVKRSLLAVLDNKAGVSTVGRAAAIRQHVLEMPAPVVADALTCHYKTTARLSTETGTDWSRYAAGNRARLRTPTGWQPRRTHD